jgi:hypothetical protein
MGKPVVRAKEMAAEPMENSSATGAKTLPRGPDGNFNAATPGSGNAREDCGNWVSRDTIEGVLELWIPFDRENIGAQDQFGRPVPHVGRVRIGCLVAKGLDLAVGVVCEELLFNGISQFREKRTRESDRFTVASEFKMNRKSPEIRLVDGGKCLVHVLRASLVGSRYTDRDAHDSSIDRPRV